MEKIAKHILGLASKHEVRVCAKILMLLKNKNFIVRKMKIIVAGYMKTGIQSLKTALTELGYECYDFLDQFSCHEEEWMYILGPGSKQDVTEHLQGMYKDVDVVIDLPASHLWEEIHETFPDAKIILTTRNEDDWFKSLQGQMDKVNDNRFYQLLMTITQTGRRFFLHRKLVFSVAFGHELTYPWKSIYFNELLLKKRYRQHNANVMQNAPKEKLFIFNVKEGWKPLCDFLDKHVPDKPFPHKNIGGSLIANLVKLHPVMQKMKKELYLSLSILIGFSVFAGYKLCKFHCNVT